MKYYKGKECSVEKKKRQLSLRGKKVFPEEKMGKLRPGY